MRPVLAVLLLLGAIAGFGSEFAHRHPGSHCGHHDRGPSPEE